MSLKCTKCKYCISLNCLPIYKLKFLRWNRSNSFLKKLLHTWPQLWRPALHWPPSWRSSPWREHGTPGGTRRSEQQWAEEETPHLRLYSSEWKHSPWPASLLRLSWLPCRRSCPPTTEKEVQNGYNRPFDNECTSTGTRFGKMWLHWFCRFIGIHKDMFWNIVWHLRS